MGVNHTVRIIPHERTLSVPADMPLLTAAQAAGLPLPHSCRSGRCGSCRALLLHGAVDYPAGPPLGLSASESRAGYVLLCQARARSDLTVEARLIASAADADIKTLPARIARRALLAPDVMQLILRVPSVEALDVKPGQYLDVLLDAGARRSYSVANAPDSASQVELHVRLVPGGRFSEALRTSLREGALLKVEGPLGRFGYAGGPRPLIFIAGGTGFAPIRALLGQALARPHDAAIHLYWGAREAAGLYELARVREWTAGYPQLHFHGVLSAAAATDGHRHGLVHQVVLEDHPQLSGFDVYAAGPPGLIEAIRREFPAHGAALERLHLDSFDYALDP